MHYKIQVHVFPFEKLPRQVFEKNTCIQKLSSSRFISHKIRELPSERIFLTEIFFSNLLHDNVVSLIHVFLEHQLSWIFTVEFIHRTLKFIEVQFLIT